MVSLYARLKELCDEKGISGYKMCKDCGIQPSVMTDLKMERRFGVSADTAARISAYFDVPVSFLTGQHPYDYWNEIDRDREGFVHFFLQQWNLPVDDIQRMYHVNPEDPNSAKISEFVRFIEATVERISLSEDGEWDFSLKDSCKQIQSAANDVLDQVDIAFYGDYKQLDDSDKEILRDMVRVMRERRAKKQGD